MNVESFLSGVLVGMLLIAVVIGITFRHFIRNTVIRTKLERKNSNEN